MIEMENVHEELEDAKAEIEKLKCNLDYKECIIQQLSSSTDAQRVVCVEKFRKLEEENKHLLVSLDEAVEENRDKQAKLDALVEENGSLKTAVCVLQKRCAEAEKEANSPNSGGWDGGHLVQELEDKYRKVEDELKWKVEQFKHLEEAHEKVRDQMRVSKSEWDSERSSLIDEIARLQEGVEDGQRTVEGLRHQLVMCRQGLENEESRRKGLERQVEELKLIVERVPNEGWGGGGMEMECSTAQNGEDEVVRLRHSLRMKEMEYKDVEYNAKKLVKENQELLASVKELQEAQIPRAVPTPSSWEKLRGKLKSLEQKHKEHSATFKAKEAEWNSQAQRMTRELDRCSSSLQIKEQTIDELKKELGSCNASLTQLKMQNEELSLMVQLMRSDMSESGTDQQGKNQEGGLVHLMEQLEREREEKLDIRSDLEKYRDLVEEAADRERKLKEELEEVYETLDTLDSELTDKTNEGGELEVELHSWKTLAERLKMKLEESQEMRRELEACLLAQAEVEEILNRDTEEKDKKISNLEQQILLMDQEIRIGEDEYSIKDEDEDEDEEGEMEEVEEILNRDTEEKDKKISNLEQQILLMDQEIRIGEDEYSIKDEDEDEDEEGEMEADDEDDEDELHIDLLARDLELAILAHITEERTRLQQAGSFNFSLQDNEEAEERVVQGFDDDLCATKENVMQQTCSQNNTGESIFDERSPFRVLN